MVPDFLSTAAPLLAALDAGGGDPIERVTAAVAGLAGEGTNLWMAAALKAEEFLQTWQVEPSLRSPLGLTNQRLQRRWLLEEPRAEQVEHLLQRIAGGVPRLVDEVLREHGVRHAGVAVRVSLRRVDLHADKAITERLP